MHQATQSALFNELTKIAMLGFAKHAESPPLFGTAMTAAAKSVAKPVKDVSRGALSLGDNIKPGPTPQGAFSFSGRKPPPLPGAKTAGVESAFILAMIKCAQGPLIPGAMHGLGAAPSLRGAAGGGAGGGLGGMAAKPAYNPKAPMLSSAGVNANTPAPAPAAPRAAAPPPGQAPDAGHAAQVAAAIAKAQAGGFGGMRMGR